MTGNIMSDGLRDAFVQMMDFPAEWVKAALVLALFSTGVVIALFFYLNHYTRKSHFNLWTVAWMFYAVWLAVSIQLEETPDQLWLVMVRRACIGIAALFMFWGSIQLTYGMRKMRELGMGVLMIIIWSYVGAYKVGDRLWITVPVFVLLASASVYTGTLYWRVRNRYRGATILATGFILWGLHLLGFAFEGHLSTTTMAAGYVSTAVLSLFIAMGMMMQVLEQARERNETLIGHFKKGVAKRRELEQEVSVADQRYRALFESASDAIFLVDLDTLEIVEVNHAVQKLTGRNAVDLSTHAFPELCPAISRGGKTPLDNKKQFDQLFRSSNEFTVLRANGSPVTCEGRASLVRSNGRPVLQINIREITERKAIEQQLRQAEKLSALGQLIAGVAHELNNPLAVIMGYAQLLGKDLPGDNRVRDGLEKVMHESERASKIVRNLLTFARPREPQMTVVNLNDVVNSVIDTRKYDLRSAQVEVTRRLEPDLPKTKADPNQMEQVLTNLITNAVQAMLGRPEPRRIEIVTEDSGDSIRITVADTGPGISAQILGKIFDPFFTTKAPGQGTGLGLSLSYSIVEEHRGKIWVQSEVGQGTKFFIELPVVPCEEPLPANAAAADALRRDPQAASRRLLVVDDEPGIVAVLEETLRGNGYSVESASDGFAAMERIDSEHYDLIITDLCMPKMDGEHLYKAVREKFPQMASRMIFVTGDTLSTKSRAFLEWTGNRWFSKPFNIREIEDVVGNFLRQGQLAAATVEGLANN